MRWLIIHLASGDAFISGILIAGGGVVMQTLARRRWARLLGMLGTIVGVGLALLSATPQPWGIQLCWIALTVSATVVAWIPRISQRRRAIALSAALVAGAISLGLELPHRFWRAADRVQAARVYVIGDSLSAGIGQEDGVTWPRILREQRSVEVVDLSISGATIAQEVRRAQDVTFVEGIVIVEIGGNDMFMRKPPAEFELDLEQLINVVSGLGRVVVMFELPLYPANRPYGAAQRRVASAHGIAMVPRHRLAHTIGAAGATLSDGIHFSADGQRRMAYLVWELIASALPPRAPQTAPSSVNPSRSSRESPAP